MGQDKHDSTGIKSFRGRLSIFILVISVAMLGYVFYTQFHVSSRVNAHESPDASPLVEKLVPHPPSEPTTFSRAMIVRKAIRQGHFIEASTGIQDVLRESRIGPWHFRPFAYFINSVTQPADDAFENRMNAWVSENPQSAVAYLASANYYFNLAWRVRGNGFVSHIQSHNIHTFQGDMGLAERDIKKAVKLDPTNPYSRFLELEILRDAEGNAAQEAAFEEAIRAFPNYYPLYEVRLATLQPKWYGSIPEMYDFVDHFAGAAPKDSPLRMMYLQLFSDLLNAASIACGDLDKTAMSRCVEATMDKITDKKLYAAAYADLKLYNANDELQFAQKIGEILNGMIMTSGGARFAGAFLQLAADGLGSDTQLVASDTAKNNYMIDRMAALVWYRKKQYENAAKLDRRALSDLSNMHFPDINAKDAARASIYNDLASIYNRENDYANVVIYAKAVSALLGGNGAAPGFSGIECASLFKLKRYEEALHICKSIIVNSGDLQTHFWLARVYDALRKNDAAIHEYRILAGSESSFREYSAIAISIIYDREKHWKEALNALNDYPYLFKPTYQGADDLAINYNDRCYDKMKLGDLKGALKDCTTSLHYGNLPDAYSKQQELLRRLKMLHN